jgi:hypothetical protein
MKNFIRFRATNGEMLVALSSIARVYIYRDPLPPHPKSTKIELNNPDGWVELTLVQMSLDEVEALIAGAQL